MTACGSSGFQIMWCGISFTADAVTAVLGILTLAAIVWKRDKISLAFRLYLNNHFNQRSRLVHEKLNQLKKLRHSNKQDRAEITYLLHSIRGQLRPWLESRQELAASFGRLDDLVEKRTKISDAQVSEVVHELEETLEGLFLVDGSRNGNEQ